MIDSSMMHTIINYSVLSDSIETTKTKNNNYKDTYNYKKYLDKSVVSLIEEAIPHFISSHNKILGLKKFHEIEWLPTKPFLKMGILLNTNDEIWYVEYSFHEGFNIYYHSCVYDLLVNCINNISISYNKLTLRSDLQKIVYFLQYLKMHSYDYVLIEKVNNTISNYYKYLCKYNNQIYYILCDIKNNNKTLFIL